MTVNPLTYQSDIVIVNYNTRHYLERCLESIRSFSGSWAAHRVWVVDNGSTDGSSIVWQNKSWVKAIINRRNRGYATACNQGIRAGNGVYIFLCNSDLVMTPHWLEPLTQLLSQPDVAVVGPRLVNPEGFLVGVGVVGTNAEPLIRGWGEPDEPFRYNEPTECISLSGACIGIKRELLTTLGLLDEHFFHYFEETDYCYQARFLGYKVVYCPDSKVVHRVYGSCRDNQRLKTYFQNGKEYFCRKWAHFMDDPTLYP